MDTIDAIGPYGLRFLCLRTEAWGDKSVAGKILRLDPGFDCFVVNHARPPSVASSDAIVTAIASRVGGWVEVFGEWAEIVHDAIDTASVSLGRQAAVGDGNPMTTWTVTLNANDVASYIWTGGQGEGTRKLVLFVGQLGATDASFRAVVEHQCGRRS